VGDLSKATAAKKHKVNLGGLDFEVGYLKMRTGGKLQAYINKLPKPNAVERVRPLLDGLASDVQKQLLLEAHKEDMAWPPQLMIDAASALRAMFTTPEGIAEFTFLMLKQSRDDLDDDKLRVIANDLDSQQFGTLFGIALGLDPEPYQTVPAAKPVRLVLVTDSALGDIVRGVLALAGVTYTDEMLQTAIDTIDLGNYGASVALKPETLDVPKGTIRSLTPSNGASAPEYASST
jgi:hypothetical protein